MLSSVRVEGVRWVTWPNKRPSTSPREVVMRCIKADNVGPDIVIFWNGRSSMAREIERERERTKFHSKVNDLHSFIEQINICETTSLETKIRKNIH